MANSAASNERENTGTGLRAVLQPAGHLKLLDSGEPPSARLRWFGKARSAVSSAGGGWVHLVIRRAALPHPDPEPRSRVAHAGPRNSHVHGRSPLSSWAGARRFFRAAVSKGRCLGSWRYSKRPVPQRRQVGAPGFDAWVRERAGSFCSARPSGAYARYRCARKTRRAQPDGVGWWVGLRSRLTTRACRSAGRSRRLARGRYIAARAEGFEVAGRRGISGTPAAATPPHRECAASRAP